MLIKKHEHTVRCNLILILVERALRGDVSFRGGCEVCQYDRAELLSIANDTFVEWREATEELLRATTPERLDVADRDRLLRRRERARVVRTQQEARLLDYLPDQIASKTSTRSPSS